MDLRRISAVAVWVVIVVASVHCGSSSSTPTTNPTPVVPIPTAAPTPTPVATLPPGMVCPSPTPPPLLRLKIGIHDDSGDRKILNSNPIVPNVDHYCDKVGFGDWKFCETRAEDHPDRTACDYLAVGIATDTKRWGPTWYFNGDLCADAAGRCANNPNNQFLAVAKTTGVFEACAAEDRPVDPGGSRCGSIEIK